MFGGKRPAPTFIIEPILDPKAPIFDEITRNEKGRHSKAVNIWKSVETALYNNYI